MTTDKKINDEQLGVESFEVPVGSLGYEFLYDKETKPNLVIFRVYQHDGDQLFGSRMPLKEWEKFVELVNRFNSKLTIIPLPGMIND